MWWSRGAPTFPCINTMLPQRTRHEYDRNRGAEKILCVTAKCGQAKGERAASSRNAPWSHAPRVSTPRVAHNAGQLEEQLPEISMPMDGGAFSCSAIKCTFTNALMCRHPTLLI
jgi:hypothetical protein